MRMTPATRQAAIRMAAVAVGNRDGLEFVTFDAVATACRYRTSMRTVRHYFPTKTELWLAAAGHPDANSRLRNEAQALGLMT